MYLKVNKLSDLPVVQQTLECPSSLIKNDLNMFEILNIIKKTLKIFPFFLTKYFLSSR